jgi:hypothetical protein
MPIDHAAAGKQGFQMMPLDVSSAPSGSVPHETGRRHS